MPSWVAFFMGFARQVFFIYSYWYFWKKLGFDPEVTPVSKCKAIKIISSDTKKIIVEANISIMLKKNTVFQETTIYTFYGDGSVAVYSTTSPETSLTKSQISSIPRIGFSFAIRRNLANITYLGRGPYENYPDRNSCSDVGIWITSPKNMGYDYIVPSENGNRSDCLWASFTSKDATQQNDGFMIIAEEHCKGFSFSALLHNQRELHCATHTHQLQDRKEGEHPIYCNLDFHLMGIGGDAGWLPCVYDEYLLEPEKIYKSQ